MPWSVAIVRTKTRETGDLLALISHRHVRSEQQHRKSMSIDAFLSTFIVLVLCCGYLGLNEYRKEVRVKPSENESLQENSAIIAARFKSTFLTVYLLVMASDWLQVRHSTLYSAILIVTLGSIHIHLVQR